MRLEASDIESLEPVIAAVVKQVLNEIRETDQRLGDRLAYSEAEAAALLSVPRYVLRDARLRGEVHARRIGRAYRYSRAALLAFVGANG